MAIHICTRKQERPQINNLTLSTETRKRTNQAQHQKKEENYLEQKEINTIENEKKAEKFNQAKSCFLKRQAKCTNLQINSPRKKKIGEPKLNNMRYERRDTITDTTEIQRTLRE